jgi:hypothetical protein
MTYPLGLMVSDLLYAVCWLEELAQKKLKGEGNEKNVSRLFFLPRFYNNNGKSENIKKQDLTPSRVRVIVRHRRKDRARG